MKRIFYLFIMVLISAVSVNAQSFNIINDLNTDKQNQGTIRILQDESINRFLGTYHQSSNTSGDDLEDGEYVKVRGWKIQVYSGNNQNARSEAEAKQAQVRETFPELETSVSYTSPVWRLRVGNFFSREAAEDVLLEMKKLLPKLAKELYIVPEVIMQPID